eukprot:TRINITY_DN54544_c0_g1_i1.p1 TRINITY_DN54544_c0_g1~~TRINITY_DN54544_c0_g1_i1.p1  ORF type:complete len:459 (+),score=87.20 TRINITY_DN54544_c0_g1_i1:84-1460(+)
MPPKAQQDDIISKLSVVFRSCLGKFTKSKPGETVQEVTELMADLKVTPRMINQFHAVFKNLQQYDSLLLKKGSDEVTVESLLRMVKSERIWVAKILILLLDIAGFRDIISWNGFLYVFLQFCSLSKLELCQVLFFCVTKEVKSWTVNYLTSTQLREFYDDYYGCPIASFNTQTIDFSKLPLAKYRMQDFIELCYRFSQLINPCLHLQRSMQQSMPSLRYWTDYDNVRTLNRKITIDFFRVKKVSSVLEIMQVETASPLQKLRQSEIEKYKVLRKAHPGYDNPEAFDAAIRRASKLCHPTTKGVVPLPFGREGQKLIKAPRGAFIPEWMRSLLLLNEDPIHGTLLGFAKDLENEKRELIPKWAHLAKIEPKSVEEAKALIIETFGEAALKSKVKPIDISHLSAWAAPPAEAKRIANIRRSQELEFIAKSRRDLQSDDLLASMDRIYKAELIERPQKEED